MSFSIFDILREEGILKEDGENNQATTKPNPPTDDTTQDNPSNNNSDTEKDDDNFDIDTNLDDGNGDDDFEENNDDMNSDDSTKDSSSSNNDNISDDSDEEVNDDNTDIFASLTAEEQQIKIKELKDLFQNMYISCDEILDRLNNLQFTEDSIPIMNRLTYSIYDLKKYIQEYIISVFPRKSYIENDIAFNRFLMILNTIQDILSRYKTKADKDENNQ